MNSDVEETARLILLENDDIGFGQFAVLLRDYHIVSIANCQEVFAKYRGWDGRIPPTHSIETGMKL